MSDYSTTPRNIDTSHCTDVAEFLRILISPGNVFEVRSIKCPDKPGGTYVSTAAGWFNDFKRAAIGVEHIESMRPPACYVTLNPVEPALLARGANRIAHNVRSTTSDADILRRRWFFVDIDAKRPAGVSATDGDLSEACKLSDKLLATMSAKGWPEPLQGMSGNGRYLLWRIDLPNDEPSKVLIQSVLKAMASQFNNLGAEIDCSTFNAARICKVLGTVARKGDELLGVEGIEDRPHRQSWFTKPGGLLEVVTVEQLSDLVANSNPKPAKSASDAIGKPSDTVERARRYLAKMEPSIEGEKGSTKLIKAAAALVRGLDMSQVDALQLLQSEFNGRCVPAWTEQELRHKVEDADKSGGERGYLLRVVKQVDEPEKPWDNPKALPNPLPIVMAYSSDLLPKSIGAAVDDIADRMQCPPDFPAAAMLVAMAALVGCRVGIRPRRNDDWLVVPNLWGCVVGRPSLKKTPAIKTAEKRIRGIEARERERLASDIESAGVDAVLAKARIKKLEKQMNAAIGKGEEPEARRFAEEIKRMSEEATPVQGAVEQDGPIWQG